MFSPTWQQVTVILALLAGIFTISFFKGSAETTALVGATGVLLAWLTDNKKPPPGSPQTPILPLFLVFSLVSCGAKYPELPPQGVAISGLVTLAHVLQGAVEACADATEFSGNLTGLEEERLQKLSQACYDVVIPAKDALAHAASAANAWSGSSQSRIGCDAKAMIFGVKALQDLLLGYGIRLDPKLSEEIQVATKWSEVLANWAAPTCNVKYPTTTVSKAVIF